jgi:hypothetical protein
VNLDLTGAGLEFQHVIRKGHGSLRTDLWARRKCAGRSRSLFGINVAILAQNFNGRLGHPALRIVREA